MKKILAVAALALIAGVLSAQGMGPGPRGQGQEFGMGKAFPQDLWKVGTVVTMEYKKVSGQLILGEKLAPVFKADGVEYLLHLPQRAITLLDVKNGDTVTFEGLAITVKGDTKVQPMFRVLKATINGKEIDLKPAKRLPPPAQGDAPRGPGMMGR